MPQVEELPEAPGRIHVDPYLVVMSVLAAEDSRPGGAAECARLRSAYQDQQAAGFMTLEELGSKLEELDKARELAQAELDALALREQRVEDLESDRDTLVKDMTEMVPEGLDGLSGEERHRVYRMLRIEVTPNPEGFRVSGALDEPFVNQERHLPVGLLLQSAPLIFPRGTLQILK